MCPDVRVHVRLGTLRLDFHGEQAFYESKVESLVEAAALRGARALASHPPRNGSASPGGAVAPPSSPLPPAAEAGPRPTAAPTAPGFSPQSPEFGRYVKRLGSEAGEPDRQVVAMAFYLWNYERRETFGREEVVGCFRALGMPPPEGLDAIFADLADRKRFLEVASEGRWRLSKKGENYVKTRLLSL